MVAVLWPERCKTPVSVSGFLITDLAAKLKPQAPNAEYAWWYQFSLPPSEALPAALSR
ncbi:hypothetical protein AB0D11_27540 [Streptomyces monashensis]|uniref:hypothetical protein n=1 Tax=Streptomyces monashensis TaxID=1678012 RepID=UPI0033FF9565